MKNQIVLAVTLIVMLGCSKKESVYSIIEDENVVVKSLVLKLGFDTTDIIIDGDKIIVEEDIVLYKSNLTNGNSRQATIFDGGPFVTASPNLKYYVPDVLRADYQIFDDAIGEIASITHPEKENYKPTFTSYQRVSEPEQADLVFTAFMENSGLFGYADWPTLVARNQELTGGSFYPVLKIGKVHFNILWWRSLPASQRKFLIIHEVGHAVGLRHTDWARSERESNGSIGAYTVPGTPNDRVNPDPISVFNSGSGTTPFRWDGFTDFDKLALFFVTSGGG